MTSDGRGNKDKTVIGGLGQPNPLPGAMPGGPRRPPPPNQATVIGGGLPPASPGFGRPADTDAWTPGGLAPPSPGFGGPAFGHPAPAHPPVAGAFAPSHSFFPEARPQEPQSFSASGPKIDLRTALQATGLGQGGPKSPILAAAANLLILFGRLRTQMVEMEAVPLMDYVTREIETFEANVLNAGVDPHEAQVAKYMLCGTADDIVQNIPGTDRHIWVQYSMVARFFNVRTSGVGFFQEVEKSLAAPAQRFQLLELALVCLSLGFEGQYRTMPNGAVELQRIRAMVYESLRRVKARPDEDISPRWQPVLVGGRRRFGGTPLWVIASVLGLMLLGAYFALSMAISGEGTAVASRLLSLHPTQVVALKRPENFSAFVPEPPADTTGQLERLRANLKADIDAKLVEVDRLGDFIFVRVNNAALFASGKSEVKPEFKDLGARITAALNSEPGPILVNGFTDNVPLSGRGRFKNNFDLSVARAQSVQKVLIEGMAEPGRVVVEGKGEADPIADNGTAEGRALNRRVEILIAREETL
jgi:type VI secretion system protein ImpK